MGESQVSRNIGLDPFLSKVLPIIGTPKVIFDIGSRDCNESVAFSELFPASRIFAFEPNPNQKNICESNIRAHHNIEFFDIALSKSSGVMDFYITNGNVGASSLLRPHFVPWASDQSVSISSVKVETLDEFCSKHTVRPDLIWMDVQGNELNTLQGGAETLKTVKAIYTEAGLSAYYDGHTMKPDIVKFLDCAGFDLVEEKIDWEKEVNLIFIKRDSRRSSRI